jgi:hypothetical protein
VDALGEIVKVRARAANLVLDLSELERGAFVRSLAGLREQPRDAGESPFRTIPQIPL